MKWKLIKESIPNPDFGNDKWSVKEQRQTAILGVQNRPRCMFLRTPVDSRSNARQKNLTCEGNYTTTEVDKAMGFLQKLASMFGQTMDNVDKTIYIRSNVNGNNLVFRLANHRGDASQFTRRNELVGNFGIVIKMNEKRFIPNAKTDYQEEVFYPDKLTPALENAICDGVANYIQTGIYNGPKGDESNPHNPIKPNPINQSVAFQPPSTQTKKVNESFYNTKRNNTMKKLNITKEQFNRSRYFQKKYGTLEYVSESGKVFKTSKGQLLKFNERTRFMNKLDVEELIFAALNKAGGVIEVKRTDNGYILTTKDNDFKIDLNIEQIDDSYDYN